jgi:hypothetical protein
VAKERDACSSSRQRRRKQRQEGDKIGFRAVVPLASLTLLFGLDCFAFADEPAWRYDVRASVDLSHLDVEAWLAAGYPAELSVDDGAEPFVRDVAVELSGRWQAVREHNRSWIVPSCQRLGCHLRYRFMLTAAADRLDSEVAGRLGSAIQSPPSTWLLHPIGARKSGEYRFHVSMPTGVQFVTGVGEIRGVADSFGSQTQYLDDAPYSAFGKFTIEQVIRPSGRIDVALVPAARALSNDAVQRWVASAAHAVESYYGRLPLPRWLIIVAPLDGTEIHGRTLGNGGATILLSVGKEVAQADVERDWVLTHEMVHLAFPNASFRQRWIEEGLATYVEPIARVRVGQLSEKQMWSDLVAGLPNGEPEPGDRGLDRTPTWGRTYWGGALFCLVADVQIREHTHNRRSLDDALRSIVAAGGTMAVRWPLVQTLEIGDRATGGVTVLRDLYARMATHPVPVDLNDLWRRLGVRIVSGHIELDDRAPEADIRRAITAPNGSLSSTPR